jgi:hypothetical protein
MELEHLSDPNFVDRIVETVVGKVVETIVEKEVEVVVNNSIYVERYVEVEVLP